MMAALAVFVSMAALDAIYALYTRRTAEGKAMSSAWLAGGMVFFTATVTILYVGNWYLVPFAAAGAFVGTYFTVRHDHDEGQH